jgi:fido (protein-threonine AMPylation protein)
MSGDLPIYSDSIFRSADPFPALANITDEEIERTMERFDRILAFDGEPASGAAAALGNIAGPDKESLVAVHRRLFEGNPDAGRLRQSALGAMFRGQDCPEPEYIEQSLANFVQWFGTDGFGELHPIQQTALALTRLVDIWPFAIGNRTTAVVFANQFLVRAGIPPFFVLPEQRAEFDQALSQAVMMQTDTLVRAIYRCIERELDLVRKG